MRVPQRERTARTSTNVVGQSTRYSHDLEGENKEEKPLALATAPRAVRRAVAVVRLMHRTGAAVVVWVCLSVWVVVRSIALSLRLSFWCLNFPKLTALISRIHTLSVSLTSLLHPGLDAIEIRDVCREASHCRQLLKGEIFDSNSIYITAVSEVLPPVCWAEELNAI